LLSRYAIGDREEFPSVKNNSTTKTVLSLAL